MKVNTNDGDKLNYEVKHGDALEQLKALSDNSVDSLVTDPPAGIGFMGKTWDDDKGGRESWVEWLADIARECLRVLKPGGHGLVWAIPRTSHWTATALEDAGFEVRDVITHHFGTGFPKSLDVSKAIDATERFGGSSSSQLRQRDGNAVGVVGTNMNTHRSGRNDVRGNSEAAVESAAAKVWAGWGTALKPASEHWILVRKPLAGTVAKNVAEHGTGALNIDGCRIEGRERSDYGLANATRTKGNTYSTPSASADFDASKGRWPANLLLSHSEDCTTPPEAGATCSTGCPVAVLDSQSGTSKSTAHVRHNGAFQSVAKGAETARASFGLSDTGGASRFFYVAKPSRAERDRGCEDRNTHPTVKPSALMRYLVRLITPPGGLVLDPFCGSGTTGIACVQEGCSFIGIEREPEYVEIARSRIGGVR